MLGRSLVASYGNIFLIVNVFAFRSLLIICTRASINLDSSKDKGSFLARTDPSEQQNTVNWIYIGFVCLIINQKQVGLADQGHNNTYCNTSTC